MISEKIELLGKGLYEDIPNELTLKAIPTACELDYVSSEDFEETLLSNIFPKAIEENINFHHLLEIDFQWICRCLRFLNYGPYYTTNRLYCNNCGAVPGEAQVDLRSVGVKPIPEDFKPDIVISKEEFVDFDGDVHLHMLTIQEVLNAYKDKLFVGPTGKINRDYARLCYMINSIGKEKNLSPVNTKVLIEKQFSSADYIILKEKVNEVTDYGLRAGGSTICPKCKKPAAFIALVDDRFLRPSVGDIKRGRNDRSARGKEDTSADQAATV